MLAALARYMANRAVSGVADGVVRRATWSAVAAVLGVIGIVMLILVAFWWLERYFDILAVGIIIAIACFLAAIVAATMPSVIDWVQRPPAHTTTEPVAEAVNAVVEEAREVADYIGPIRLVGSAFMLGLGVGRQFSR